MPLPERLLEMEILACPDDKGPLWYFAADDVLYNPRLRRRYEIREDIPVLLIDEASDVDEAEHERLSELFASGAGRTTFEEAGS